MAVEKEAKDISFAYDSNVPKEKIFKVVLPKPVEFQIQIGPAVLPTVVEKLSPKSELRRQYLRREAIKLGLPVEEDQEAFHETEPDFHLRKFYDARIKPPRVYGLIRNKQMKEKLIKQRPCSYMDVATFKHN